MAWKKGQSGNLKGRPRSGKSLAEAIRRTVDPEAMIAKLVTIAETSPNDQTRLRAIEMLMERGWKKPAQVVEVGPADPYEDLTDEELRALEEATAAELAVAEAEILGLPAGVAVDADVAVKTPADALDAVEPAFEPVEVVKAVEPAFEPAVGPVEVVDSDAAAPSRPAQGADNRHGVGAEVAPGVRLRRTRAEAEDV